MVAVPPVVVRLSILFEVSGLAGLVVGSAPSRLTTLAAADKA